MLPVKYFGKLDTTMESEAKMFNKPVFTVKIKLPYNLLKLTGRLFISDLKQSFLAK